MAPSGTIVPAATNASSPRPLTDCCNFRAFWLKWNVTTVQLGTGRVVGSSAILTHTVPQDLAGIRFLYLFGRRNIPMDVFFCGCFPNTPAVHCRSNSPPPLHPSPCFLPLPLPIPTDPYCALRPCRHQIPLAIWTRKRSDGCQLGGCFTTRQQSTIGLPPNPLPPHTHRASLPPIPIPTDQY